MIKRLTSLLTGILWLWSMSAQDSCRWWFDDKAALMQSEVIVNGEALFTVDASALSYGIHRLHLYAFDGITVSSAQTFYFVKLPQGVASGRAFYHWWFDDDMEQMHNGRMNDDGTAAFTVNAAALSDGLHRLNIMADDGQYLSSTETRYFLKLPHTDDPLDDYMCILSVDDREWMRREHLHAEDLMELQLDLSELALGIHELHAVVIASNGQTAFYSTEFNHQYVVSFYNYNRTLLYRDTVLGPEPPEYGGQTPVRLATPQWSYTFAGWRDMDNAAGSVLAELPPADRYTSYIAAYDSTFNSYDVLFLNYNGDTLQKEHLVYGAVPVYKGVEPVRPSTEHISYTFLNWRDGYENEYTTPLPAVKEKTVFRANYSSEVHTYTIRFLSEDGLTVLQSGQVAYGEMPVYDGAMPEKDEDEQYTYVFSTWTPNVASVTGDADYRAVFNAVQRKPDAIVSDFYADADEKVAGSGITFSLVVGNTGDAILPAHSQVQVMLGSAVAAEVYTEADILPGQTAILTAYITLPLTTGEHSYRAVVNSGKQVPEHSYQNNRSETVTVNALPPFIASITTDKTVYRSGETVHITGQITGVDVAGQEVEIYAVNYGYRATLIVTSDAYGHFTADYTPIIGQFGHFALGACYRYANDNAEMAGIDVCGIRVTEFPQCKTAEGQPYNGVLKVRNMSAVSLTNLQVSMSAVDNVSLAFTSVEQLDANAVTEIPFVLTTDKVTAGADWESIPLTLTTDENVTAVTTLYYYCQTLRGDLYIDFDSINTTMSLDYMQDYSFWLYNKGKGETGEITLSLPEFIQSQMPQVIPSIPAEGCAAIHLRLVPDSRMRLNMPVSGQISVGCTNADGLAIPYRIEPVSDRIGSLKVDVCDEYTYNTAGKPHVKDAYVLITHPSTGEKIASGQTDENGLFETELNAGYYGLIVGKENHQLDTSVIFIQPEQKTFKVVNLSITPIKVYWSVKETEVVDEYEIVTTLKYETRVPVPVVVLEVPKKIDADLLEPGESLIFEAKLTNKGLITAQDVELLLPDNPALDYKALAYAEPFNLDAQKSVSIPVKVTRKNGTENIRVRGLRAPQDKPIDNDPCVDYPGTLYFWDCGPDHKYHRYHALLQLGSCRNGQLDPPLPHDNNNNNRIRCPIILRPDPPFCGGGWNIPQWLNNFSGWFYQGGGDDDCEPCVNTWLYHLVRCGMHLVPATREVLDFEEREICKPRELAEAIHEDLDSEDGIPLNTMDCYLRIFPLWRVVTYFREVYDYCWEPLSRPCNDETAGNLDTPQRRASSDEYSSYRGKDYSAYPSYIENYIKNTDYVMMAAHATLDMLTEICGDTIFAFMPEDTIDAFAAYLPVWDGVSDEIWQYKTENIPDDRFARFVERLHNTKFGVESENKVDLNRVKFLNEIRLEAFDYARSLGYTSVIEMLEKEEEKLNEEREGSSAGVCATVTLRISQTMVMTRQAFEGSLIIENGSTEEAMTDIMLNLQVINTQTGELTTAHEFQINVNSLKEFDGPMTLTDGWTLEPGAKGTATIMFIPTKYAALTDSVKYSFGGTLTYTDPYSGYTVTRSLYPHILTVAPAPSLQLTYFMQRDILGDDPLTDDEVEAMEEAEFALLINNIGYGTAKNLTMTTHQPQIIENEKGLLIDFALVRSMQNGVATGLTLDSTLTNTFGTILPHTTTYAQWYMTSTLLGHFVKYDVAVKHISSYGNSDLSLIDTATVHEMIHSVDVPSASPHLCGWLVNDMVDDYDMPDMLYRSDGSKQPLLNAQESSISRTGEMTCTLHVISEGADWMYGSVADPMHGRGKLTRIVRQSDNAEISLRNFWLTDRTLRDGRDPLKEYRIHFADSLTSVTEDYTLYFTPKPQTELDIVAFSGIPATTQVSDTEVNNIQVEFNGEIDADSFSAEDITLSCDGRAIDVASVSIIRVSEKTYLLDMNGICASDGYYYLKINLGGIIDTEGFAGNVKSLLNRVSWMQQLKTNVSDSLFIGADSSENLSELEITEQTILVVEPDGGLNVDMPGLNVNTVIIKVNGSQSGQIHYTHSLQADRVLLDFQLHPDTMFASPDRWYAFALPFPVDISTGIRRCYGNPSHISGKDFLVMEYDGQQRAATGKGWKRKLNGILQPGMFYMMGIDGNCNHWLFEKQDGAVWEGSRNLLAEVHQADNPLHAGWNGIGNSTLEYADITISDVNYVLTYDNQHGIYSIYDIDHIHLVVGQPFFAQVDANTSVVFSTHNPLFHAPLRANNADKNPMALVTMNRVGEQTATGRMYLTIGDDDADAYTIGRDVQRMVGDGKNAVQIWCEAYNTQLSAYKAALNGAVLEVPLGIYTPANGIYQMTISSEKMQGYTIDLMHDNVIIGTFAPNGTVDVSLFAGSHTDYTLRICKKIPTNTEQMTSKQEKCNWYDVLGRPVQQGRYNIPGVYIRRGEKIVK